jgi:hypothetical protein
MPETDRRDGWGPWALNFDAVRLEINGGDLYYLNLDGLRSPGGILDAIAQVRAKHWADDEAIAGLVRAVDDLWHLQANLCPSGAEHHLDDATFEHLLVAAYRTHERTVTP